MGQKIVIIALILTGLLARVWGLDKIPPGLFSDEIAIAIDAKTIADNGTDQFGRRYPLTFEALSDWRLPVYVYLDVPFYKIFGATTFTPRLPSLVASIISILLLGILAEKLFPKKGVGLYAALALALSPYHSHFARIAYESNVATMFLLAYLISLFNLVTGQKRAWWFTAASVFLILGSWTYSATTFIAPAVTLAVGGCLRKRLWWLGGLLLVFAMSFYPSTQFPVLNGRPLGFVSEGLGKLLFVAGWLRIWTLEFLFDKGDIVSYRHGTLENGVFLLIFNVPFFLGIVKLIRDCSIRIFGAVFLAISFLVATIPSALTSATPYGPRFLPAVPFLALFVGLGISEAFLRIRQLPKLRGKILAVVLVVLVFQYLLYLHTYFVHFAKNSLPSFPLGPVTMAHRVETYVASGKKVYYSDERNCRSWGHDDLTLWYFNGLDNAKMIAWNNQLRDRRYKSASGAFGAYDEVVYPTLVYSSNLVLFPGSETNRQIPRGAINIRCGELIKFLDPAKEKLVDTIYMYEKEKDDPYYVITEQL